MTIDTFSGANKSFEAANDCLKNSWNEIKSENTNVLGKIFGGLSNLLSAGIHATLGITKAALAATGTGLLALSQLGGDPKKPNVKTDTTKPKNSGTTSTNTTQKSETPAADNATKPTQSTAQQTRAATTASSLKPKLATLLEKINAGKATLQDYSTAGFKNVTNKNISHFNNAVLNIQPKELTNEKFVNTVIDANPDPAKRAETLISVLPKDKNIKTTDRKKIVEARKVYNGLSPIQKSYIKNLPDLQAAEATLQKAIPLAKAQPPKLTTQEKKAADAVMSQIRSLPDPKSINNKNIRIYTPKHAVATNGWNQLNTNQRRYINATLVNDPSVILNSVADALESIKP